MPPPEATQEGAGVVDSMSRSGYSDDLDNWAMIKWRGQVASAIRGARGQAFFRDLIAALESLPAKRLISGALKEENGEVCALGAVGARRGIAIEALDPEDHEGIAERINIAHQLAQEVAHVNDNDWHWAQETSEDRWERVYAWAKEQLKVSP